MRQALAILLIALLAMPASQGFHNVDGLTLLLDEKNPLPRWHSVILEWEGTKRITGHLNVIAPRSEAYGREFPRGGDAVYLERQREDGSWGWMAGFEGHAAGLGNSGARVTAQGPIEVTHEVLPKYHLGDGSSFGWGFTTGPGRYRVTSWAASGVPDATFQFDIWGEPGVRLLAHKEGTQAAWIEADDHALVAAGATVLNHGAWIRTLARASFSFEHNAFMTNSARLASYQTCICLHTGPYPGWDGSARSVFAGSVINGPPGTYTIDVLASQNNREFISPSTRVPAPASYNDGLAWVMADVEHAVAPDELIDVTAPTVRFGTPSWTRGNTIYVRGSATDEQSGVVSRRIAEDLTSEPWEPASNGSFELRRTVTSGDGRKTIQGQFQDAAGNVRSVSSDTIVDTRPPIITPLSPQPDSTENSIAGFKVQASFADDTSVTTDVTGTRGTWLQVFWYDALTQETTEVTNHPRMKKTDTGFTFEPVVVPGEFYWVQVLKPDQAENVGVQEWGFWT